MRILADKLNKIAYDLSGKNSKDPFQLARQALLDWQNNPTTSEEHAILRTRYETERDKRQDRYQKKIEKAERKINFVTALVNMAPILEAAELYEERKQIKTIINSLYGQLPRSS